MCGVKLSPKLYFSYGQFMVYDASVAAPGCLWTDDHTAQGFARRESTVCFRSLFEFGYADIAVTLGSTAVDAGYDRVIAVPFAVTTGKVMIEGPEENDGQRLFELPTGAYRLIAAQRAVGNDEEVIDLYFERLNEPLRQSEIVIADSQLQVPAELVETAETA